MTDNYSSANAEINTFILISHGVLNLAQLPISLTSVYMF